MTAHAPVPLDTAAEIRELSEEGHGRNKIGQLTGINSSTVRNVLEGKAVEFCDELTTRQVSSLLSSGFGPISGR